MATRICKICGESNPENFYSTNQNACKVCLRKRSAIQDKTPQARQRKKLYRQKPERKAIQAKYYKEWYAKHGRTRSGNYIDSAVLWIEDHPKEVAASQELRKAIKAGLIRKPPCCAMCGRSHTRINGHHENYNLPHTVIWLCSSCHKKLHNSRVSEVERVKKTRGE